MTGYWPGYSVEELFYVDSKSVPSLALDCKLLILSSNESKCLFSRCTTVSVTTEYSPTGQNISHSITLDNENKGIYDLQHAAETTNGNWIKDALARSIASEFDKNLSNMRSYGRTDRKWSRSALLSFPPRSRF